MPIRASGRRPRVPTRRSARRGRFHPRRSLHDRRATTESTNLWTARNATILERRLDNTVNDSFPASDPPAHTGITGTGGKAPIGAPPDKAKRPPSNERGADERPTGSPTSERHATETAHHWEDEARQ